MIANLFHAPEIEGQSAMGTATIGSSEAIMLGTLVRHPSLHLPISCWSTALRWVRDL